MSSAQTSPRVAVVGAGIAGSTCAQALAAAGWSVCVVDKSRGPGGRLATRRLAWVDPHGQARRAGFDHGAPGVTVRTPAMREAVDAATRAGVLRAWATVAAPGGRACEEGAVLQLGMPDMPAWCRWLLQGLSTRWSWPVVRLHRSPGGWWLESADGAQDGPFDAVVLALPPAQAAPLLAHHRREWAQRASLALMQPCWTLMGVTSGHGDDRGWDIGRPQAGALAWVARNDARPGRAAEGGEAHWVLHARAGWSRHHLEHPPAWVQAQLQSALQDWLGRPLDWQHAVVHRWRYARPAAGAAAPGGPCWWDAALGLGVCGDFLGGSGVEGAWQSARTLADRVLADPVARHAAQAAQAAEVTS